MSIYDYQPLWGSWTIENQIGEGTFGKVYKISKDLLGKTHYAAVKIISIPTKDQLKFASSNLNTSNPEILESYFNDILKEIVNEINILYDLNGRDYILNYDDHQIIQRKDCDFGWDILIKMEFATSLTEYIENNSLTSHSSIKIIIDILRGLDICHDKNIIHRDLKEDNIFYSKSGKFKLGDFGVSKNTQNNNASTLIGTLNYLAPEIYKGSKYSNNVDTYSLGIILYKFFNYGRLPFMPLHPETYTYKDFEIAQNKRLTNSDIPLPSNSNNELNTIILKAINFEPSKRYSKATDFIEDLENILKNNFDDFDLFLNKNKSNLTNTIDIKKETSLKTQMVISTVNVTENPTNTINSISLDNTKLVIQNNSENTKKDSPIKKLNFKISKKIILHTCLYSTLLVLILFFAFKKNYIPTVFNVNNSSKTSDNIKPTLTNSISNGLNSATLTNGLLASQTPLSLNVTSNLPPNSSSSLAQNSALITEGKVLFYPDSESWNIGNNFLLIDINGDSKKEIFARHSNGNFDILNSINSKFYHSLSFDIPAFNNTGWEKGNRFFPMNINNDGKEDLLARYSSGDLAIWLSDGSKLIYSTNLKTEYNDNIYNTGSYFFVIDINGDKKDDLLVRNPSGSFTVWTSNGSTLIRTSEFTTTFIDSDDWFRGNRLYSIDLNGDKKVDLIARNAFGDLIFGISDGTKLVFSSSIKTDLTDVNLWNEGLNRIFCLDINGDEKGDLIAISNNGKVSVWISDGSKLNLSNSFISSFFSNSSNLTNKFFVGNFDNDKKDELLIRFSDGTFKILKYDGASFK